jgi:hypothetical protein
MDTLTKVQQKYKGVRKIERRNILPKKQTQHINEGIVHRKKS